MKRLLIILITLIQLSGFAQQFHFKNYSIGQGLPRAGVYDIYQDSFGFIWIGTEGGGVCRFDGYNFKVLSKSAGLPSDNVRVIYEDSKHLMWFGTDKGICVYDGLEIRTISLGDTAKDVRIRAINEAIQGQIWVGTDNGLSFIDATKNFVVNNNLYKQNFIDSTVRGIFKIENKIYVGTDSGLYIHDKNQFALYPNQSKLSSYRILDVFKDSKGALWISTSKGVNHVVDTTVIQYTVKDGLINNRVRKVIEDSHGNYWIATSRGVSIFDGYFFTNLSEQNGLTNERIRCMIRDNFDNIWLGTFFGGILRFNYKDFAGYSTNEGLASNQIQAIDEDEYGDILVGTNEGLTNLEIVDNKVFNYSTLKLSDSYMGKSVKAVCYDKNGYTWLGTGLGISVVKFGYRKDIVFNNIAGSTENVNVNVIKNYNDKYFIGTNKGLFSVKVVGNYESFQIVNLSENNKMEGQNVSSIYQDKANRIWVGFADGKLSVYDNTKIVTPVLADEVSSITTLTVDDDNNLWIGTNGNGLFKGVYEPNQRTMEIVAFSKMDGLSSDYVYSILYAKKMIWLGHEKGIDILKIENDSIKNIMFCGDEIGFNGLQNNPNTSLIDSKGNLWFGTVNGLFCLNNSEIDRFLKGSDSKIYLTNIKVNDKLVDWSSSGWCDSVAGYYETPVNLSLPYNQNKIEFEFIGLNYIAPEKLYYQFKLEGLEYEWNQPTKDRHIVYTNLHPGDYSFVLKVSNEMGQFSENEYRFNFVIRKPFWATWWFRILAIIVFFLLGVAIMRWRTKSLRENQKKLEKVIEERTAEISSQKEMLEEKNKEITDSIFYSRRIQRSVLPAKEKVAKLLDDYFIFFRPKDIVSGDFYWAEKSLDRKKVFFAVADCTGHGVPGAMVSLIGTRSLNTAIREIGLEKPGDILDNVNDSMIESFTEAETGNVIKDGMDIALCSIEYNESNLVKFQYAGAQNPVWIIIPESENDLVVNGEKLEVNIISNGYKLFEIKGTKQPIGYFDGRKNFINNSCDLQKGNRIYLFSDGFADQFGGEKGKKFKYKTLKELVLSVQNESMKNQHTLIRDAFYEWKREFEQIDDVCLMGVII